MTHFLAQTAAVLLRDSLGHRHGGYTTRLRAADLPPGGVTCLRQVLSDLGGLTRTRFSNYNQDLIVVDGLSRERTNCYYNVSIKTEELVHVVMWLYIFRNIFQKPVYLIPERARPSV